MAKSPPIQLRVDAEVWPLLEARARQRGMSPGQWVARQIERALRASEPVVPTTTEARTEMEPCAHAKTKVGSSGAVLCTSCGARKVGAGWVSS